MSDNTLKPLKIKENLTFGIDLGLASCGWAVIDRKDPNAPDILAAGSWCFNMPEEDKTRKPLNQNRREKRLLRRVLRRRRQRMQNIRKLFHQAGLFEFDPDISLGTEGRKLPNGQKIDPEDREILGHIGAYLRKESWDNLSPWILRTRGLDVKLSGPELAVALGHIAKHRGFKSNAKNGGKEDSTIKEAYGAVAKIIEDNPQTYRTFAEVLTQHPDYQTHKGRLRNRHKIYDCTPSRDLLLKEVKEIFDNQRDLGSKIATPALEQDFIHIAFFQRGLQDSYRLLGNCPFEKSEKRAAMKAPSFEKFRFFSKLNHIEIPQVDRDGLISNRRLFPEELAGIAELLTKPKKKFTYKDLRKFLQLNENLSFENVPFKEEGKKEIALSSNKSEGSFSGSYALFQILGAEIWASLHQSAKKLKTLDDCAEILSFFASPENMAKEFKRRHIPEEIYTPLLDAVENGKFNDFTKAANLSTKACRKILPYLLEGNVYSAACEMAGYNHAAAARDHWSQIRSHKDFVQLIKDFTEGQDRIANPSARKALTEGLKQLWAMRNKFGLPGKIAIELAREVGKSANERGKLKSNLDQTTAERNQERKEAAEALGINEYRVSSEILLRYRLWKEQKGFCLYSGKAIPAGQFHSPEFEVDHILPKSRSFDNSFNNKTLACLSENRKKGNLTPYEYFNAAKPPEEWCRFQEAVEQISRKGSKCGIKKKNYLTKTLQEGLTERHLNDTRYASRLMAQCAELFYDTKDRQRSKGSERRVFTRPGALTAALRVGWEVEHLKKEKEKNPKTGRRERIPDDRHHALNAICVACVDEKEILKIQKSFQENENRTNDDRNLRKSPLPWKNFPEDVKAALDNITVARPENRRARGEGHKETIRRFKISEKTETLFVFSRKSLKGLKTAEVQKLVGRLKDPERNLHIKAALETWISQGCPPDTLPRSPKGDEIRRIVVKEDQKSGIPLKTGRGEKSRKGLVAAASITRVDIFSKQKTNGKNKGQKEFYFVPVYSWQIMRNLLPQHACTPNKEEKDWLLMDEAKGFLFEFSLYPGSYIKIKRKRKGKEESVAGYFTEPNRSTASFRIKNANLPKESESVSPKSLLLFEKYHIDRFGQLHKAGKESR